MDMSGEHRIPAPREAVWKALNDPEVLKACIPGCEEMNENEAGDGFDAKVKAKVGPVKATFSGSVKLENVNAPESYTISGEGKGGAAGFAKGSADVHLADEGEETLLSYKVKAQIGGKLAQLGSRLVDSTAKKYANDFFTNFVEQVGTGQGEAPASKAESEAGPEAGPEPEPASEAEAGDKPTSTAEVDDGMKEAEAASAPSPSKAAADAVDDLKKKRKGGMSGMSWAMIVVIAALIALAVFTGADMSGGAGG
jgi:carbon monoxide dehydrogenase subunit G